MTAHAPAIPHPRIAQRRAAVSEAARSVDRRRRRTLWGVLGVSILLLSGYLMTRSEFLDVDEVAVSGVARTPAVAVLEAAGVGRGEPLIGLDLPAARARIARLPWVDEVYSTRRWDGSVRFAVTERDPVAAVAMPGAWGIVDVQGRVLTLSGDLDESPIPESPIPVLGLNILEASPGDWLTEAHLDAVKVAAALYEPARSAVRSVALTPQGYVLDLRIPGRVILGSGADLEAKLLAVTTFLEKVNLRCLDYLDVRAPSAPVLTRGDSCR